MTNRLVKDITVIREPTDAVPELSGIQSQYLCGFYPRDAYIAAADGVGYTGFIVNSLDGVLDYALLTSSPPLSGEAKAMIVDAYFSHAGWLPWYEWVYVCALFNVPITIPAVPADPGLLDYNIGWTGAARSEHEFFNNGQVTFKVLVGGAYIVGLQSPSSDGGPSAVEFGFKIAGQTIRIIESGTVTNPAYGSTISASSVFKIKHVHQAIRYYIDDVLMHTSALTDDVARTFWLKAWIHEGGMFIDEPTISALGEAAITLPSLQMLGGEGTPGSGANLVLPMLTMTSRAMSGAALSLPALLLIGGRPIGGADLTLPALQVNAYSGLLPGNGAFLRLPKLSIGASGLTGGVGGAALVLPAMLARGTEGEMAEAALVLPALAMLGAAHDSTGEVYMSSFAEALSAFSFGGELLVTMNSAGTIVSVMAVGIVKDAAMASAGALTDALTTSMVVQAVMNSTGTGAGFVPIAEQDNETWVVNLDTNASSTYENFGFNSFGQVGDVFIGVREDGVYLLDGDTDDGDAIHASVSYGKQDFGSRKLKRMESAYAGVSSSGTMYLKIRIDDTTEYVYAARRSDDFQRLQRIDVGRGIKATYLTFDLYNSDGCDFELATVEFHAVEMTRRI